VRRCRLTPLKSKLKPPGTNRLKLMCDVVFQLLLPNSTCAATTSGMSAADMNRCRVSNNPPVHQFSVIQERPPTLTPKP